MHQKKGKFTDRPILKEFLTVSREDNPTINNLLDLDAERGCCFADKAAGAEHNALCADRRSDRVGICLCLLEFSEVLVDPVVVGEETEALHSRLEERGDLADRGHPCERVDRACPRRLGIRGDLGSLGPHRLVHRLDELLHHGRHAASGTSAEHGLPRLIEGDILSERVVHRDAKVLGVGPTLREDETLDLLHLRRVRRRHLGELIAGKVADERAADEDRKSRRLEATEERLGEEKRTGAELVEDVEYLLVDRAVVFVVVTQAHVVPVRCIETSEILGVRVGRGLLVELSVRTVERLG